MESISESEFTQFQKLLYEIAGISLSTAKKPLVVSRLSRRLREHNLSSYGDYFRLLGSKTHPLELQMAVDLLTTNETYFFREAAHFEFLRQHLAALSMNGSPFRVWSAACSSGQEPYTIAMVLADVLGSRKWEILGTDISTRVLETARKGQYPLEQSRHIPQDYLKRFCLKGVGEHDGTFMMDRALRDRIRFDHVNLNKSLSRLGEFDVIFLRNVMIYFDMDTKREVVARLQQTLKPGGYLLIGHSETLNGVSDAFRMQSPSIYQKR